jgi:hypothetical protein
MKDFVCALWGLLTFSGLLVLVALIAVVWASRNIDKFDSFFEKDK